MNRPLTQRTTLSILIAAVCLAVFGLAPVRTAHAQGTVVTTPLQQYGLGKLRCAALSPDGKRLATGGDNGVHIWDVETGQIIRKVQETDAFLSVAFSPDGKEILSGGFWADSVTLSDVGTGRPVRSFTWPDYGNYDIIAVAISSDKTKALAGLSWRSRIVVWDINSGEELREFTVNDPNRTPLKAALFSPDGQTVLGVTDMVAELWDINSGTSLRTWPGGICAAFSPDGSRVIIGGVGQPDFCPTIWNVSSGLEIRRLETGVIPTSVGFFADGEKVVVGTSGGDVQSWELNTGNMILKASPHSGWVYFVASLSSGTEILSAADDNRVVRWDASSGEEIRAYYGHTPYLSFACFFPGESRVVTTYQSGWGSSSFVYWDLATGSQVEVFGGYNSFSNWGNLLAFWPDGTKVAVGDFGQVRLRDARTGASIRDFPMDSWVRSIALSPVDGTSLLAGSEGLYDGSSYKGIARLWNTNTGALVHEFSHGSWVTSVAFSPDGGRALTGSWDKTAKIWDTTTLIVIVSFWE